MTEKTNKQGKQTTKKYNNEEIKVMNQLSASPIMKKGKKLMPDLWIKKLGSTPENL